jgi:hypothetical protein
MSDTSDNLPLDPDELASSYLDGELSDDQRALVEADPGAMGLVERHRRVRDALAAPVEPLPGEQREAMLAAALAALPAVGATGASETGAAAASGDEVSRGGDGQVVPIDHARRARRRRLIAGALAAAAAVAVIGLVVARPGGGNGGGEATSDKGGTAVESAAGTAGASAAESDSGTHAGTAAGDAAGGVSSTLAAAAAAAAPPLPRTSTAPDRGSTTTAVSAPSIVAATGLPDLGPLADRTALIAAARPFATTVPAPGSGPCAGYPPPLATATFQGTPAYLVVIEQSASGNRVALVATGTCTVLVKADLAEG